MNCPFCLRKRIDPDHPNRLASVVKHGAYKRRSDRRTISRYFCKKCNKTFSSASDDREFGQNKRHLNTQIGLLLASQVSLRRIALLLGISRKTVDRKLRFLGQLSQEKLQKLRDSCSEIPDIQFDELQTIEHTKCKPLSVAVCVESGSRKVLGFSVASMPATGPLAQISRKKYGLRKDDRLFKLNDLMTSITQSVSPKALIRSDQHPLYPGLVQQHFPQARHLQINGSKCMVAGQGELKKAGRDPLFAINHTLAMCRANINRLIRRTWCTTKKPDRLADHLAIYFSFHNAKLTPAVSG